MQDFKIHKFKAKYRRCSDFGIMFRQMLVSCEREDGKQLPDVEFQAVEMTWYCCNPEVKFHRSFPEALWNGEEVIVDMKETH